MLRLNSKRSDTSRVKFLIKLGLFAFVLSAMVPGRVMAAESCNPDLDFTIVTPGPFFVGETLRIHANLGAGNILNGSYQDIYAFGYALDCQFGQNFASCNPDDNTIQFLGNLSTNCRNPDNDPVTLLFPQSNVIPITTSGGPIRTGPNQQCEVEFDFRVVALNGQDIKVRQSMGWPIENAPNTVCRNSAEEIIGTNAASANIAFNVHTCDIDVQKQVSTDGQTWFEADSVGTAPSLDIGDTAYYRLVVKNTGTATYAAPITINDPALGIINATTPALLGGQEVILTGNEIASLTKAGRCEVVGNLENTASVSAMCRTGDNPVSASDDDIAYLVCTEPPVPDFTIVKSSPQSPGPLTAPGIVSYNYLVTNTGNVTLTNLQLADTNTASAPVCDSTTLAVGASTNCSATHTFTQAELDAAGNAACGLYNLVTATTTEVGPREDELCIPVLQTPSMTVEKSSATSSLSAPATVTYNYLVTNTGNVVITGLSLADDNDNDDMVCVATTIAVGGSTTCSATHTFTQAELDAGKSGSQAAGTCDTGLYNVVVASSNETPDATDDLCIPIVKTPTMTVEKSSATSSLSAPATVTYNYLVTNTGNVVITGLSLADDNDNDDMVCVATTIAVGGSTTCSATHTFTQAELDAGKSGSQAAGTCDTGLYNVVVASSNETPDATDDLCIPIVKTPTMTVEKSSATSSLSAPATVTYNYLVTNTGNVVITGLSLADDNDNDDMVCVATTIAVGGSTTCSATHTFTQAELDAGKSGSQAAGTCDTGLYNVVVASSNETPDATDDLCIPIVKTPTMTVEKSSATSSLSAPATVTYNYLVTNTGNVVITGLSLADDNDNDDMVCVATTIAVGGSTTCSATHTFTQAELDAGKSGSQAAGTCDTGLYNVVVASSNETPDATDDLCIPIVKTPTMTVEKSSATSSLNAPATVTYNYLVTNTGNVVITGLSLADDNDNDDMVCVATTIAVGGSTTCSATHTFTQAELDAGKSGSQAAGTCDTGLYNVVVASSNETPDATDDLCIPIVKTPTMTVEKSSATSSLSAPATVTYNYLVTNTGNVVITGLSLADDNDNDDMVCVATTIAVGGSTTCSATHTFTQAELDAGKSGSQAAGTCDTGLYNVVVASSNETPDATDDLCIPIVKTPTMTVEKSSATSSLSAPATVTYNYLVTNTGNVVITGLSLADDNDNDDMVCVATTIAVGGSTTCSATHTFTQAELDAGKSGSQAAGTCDTGLYNVVVASSNETPDATDDLCIPITKTPCDISVSLQCEVLQSGADPTDPPQPSNACVVFPEIVECTQRPSSVRYRYLNGDCSQSSNTQDADKFECEDFAPAGDGPFEIRFSDNKFDDFFIATGVMHEDIFEVDYAALGFQPPKISPETYFEVYENGQLVQSVRFHTSCSQNLFIGDQFGNLELYSWTTQDGEVGLNDAVELILTITNSGAPAINWIFAEDDNATPSDLGDDQLYIDGTVDDEVASGDFRLFMRTARVSTDSTFVAYASAQNASNPAETCTASDDVLIQVEAPPTPLASCLDGQPAALLFEYVGGDCSIISNTQDGIATCEDFAPLGTDPGKFEYAGKDAGNIMVTPSGEVVRIGDEVLISTSRKDKSKALQRTTKVEVKRDGVKLQEIEIGTSCDQPLNVGDRFGSLILREFIPK